MLIGSLSILGWFEMIMWFCMWYLLFNFFGGFIRFVIMWMCCFLIFSVDILVNVFGLIVLIIVLIVSGLFYFIIDMCMFGLILIVLDDSMLMISL